MDILVRARDHATSVFRRIGSGASSMGGRFSKLGAAAARMGKMAALGVGVAGGAALIGIKQSIDAASDLNESLSKVGVVFGPQANSIIKWSKGAASAMGQSQQQALEAVGTFGNLISATGVASQKTAGMSTVLTQLAGDLASFNNADPSEVLVNLRSGLVGEAEPLRKYGVQLSAARIEQEAVNLGLAKSGEELSAAAKMQAAYAIILQDTKTAQGDFARTSDGVANRQRIVAAQFEDLKAKVGSVFLPIWQTMLGWFSKGISAFKDALPDIMRVGKALFEGVGNALRVVTDWLGRVWKAIGPAVTAFGKELWGSLKRVWQAIIQNLWPALVQLWNAIRPVVKVVAALVGVVIVLAARAWPFVIKAMAFAIRVFAGIANGVRGVIGWVLRAAHVVGKVFVGAWNAMKNGALGAWYALERGIVGIGNSILHGFEWMVNRIIDGINWLIQGFNKIPFVGDISKLGHVDFGTLRASFAAVVAGSPGGHAATQSGTRGSQLADGGVVTRTGLALVHAGEVWSGIGKDFGPFDRNRRERLRLNIDRRRWVKEADYEVTYGGV